MMSAATPDELRTLELKIAGMDCAECTQHVQRALATLPGVAEANVSLTTEKAIVRYEPTRVDLSAFRQAIERAGYQLVQKTMELRIGGMDCAECTRHVQLALAAMPGVQEVRVLLSSEKAIVQVDPALVDETALRQAVANAGYTVAEVASEQEEPHRSRSLANVTRPILTLFGLVFGVVLLVVIAGEWLGLFERVTDLIPWYLGWGLVVLAGYPIFWKVIKATLRRQIISHTLMSLGVLAALVVGQWPTAVVIVFFMRVGDYAEHFTTERSRQAVKRLTTLAPQTARVERDGVETVLPIQSVQAGETILVRPGETIPVDGEVLSGQATVNQATMTGESMPTEVTIGSRVFAATIAERGSLRIQAIHVGAETTFGRVIKMVEEAEAHRAPVQRMADRFSTYFLPVVASIAVLTLLISRNALAAAAVLVVACSCSFALATPIAMLASIGAAAKRGLLVKGGKYLEALSRADVLLIDKTGTITMGHPQITDVVPLSGVSEEEVLTYAASVERDSEHPLAEAVQHLAKERNVPLTIPQHFEAIPGKGVRARLLGTTITVGNASLLQEHAPLQIAQTLEHQGKTLLYVERNGQLIGLLAASDTIRGEVPAALARLRTLGVKHIELLTGDTQASAAAQAEALGIAYRAQLLPEEKIRVVKAYQEEGRTVVMVGDGVNDAPALAQADVGIAMGVMGTDIALEAAHAALLREDWHLVPDLFAIAQRTMRVVKMNLSFTILYNLVGLSLAALGILPPILAAAAQSLPDLGILANSSRLLRQRLPNRAEASPVASLPHPSPDAACSCGNDTCSGTKSAVRTSHGASPIMQPLQLTPRGSWKRGQ